MYNMNLWHTSGHAAKYAENMFSFDVEHAEFALKPMNCPGHCLMFKSKARSYRELPLRYADFGVLHRNELSGALTGLTRVRRFQQDDAHIFCSVAQIREEVLARQAGVGAPRRAAEPLARVPHLTPRALRSRLPASRARPLAGWPQVLGVLELIKSVYAIFGMSFSLCLSTRPETKIGDDALWDKAEALMEAALNEFGQPWKLNAGDGAFYGPKIDVR